MLTHDYEKKQPVETDLQMTEARYTHLNKGDKTLKQSRFKPRSPDTSYSPPSFCPVYL